MVKTSQLSRIANEQGQKLHSQIKANNFMAVQDTLNYVCRTITQADEFINDEFVNAVVKEVYGEFGGDQIIATERGYPIDFKPHEKKKMDVVTACGGIIQVDAVDCNMPYTSEVFKQYYDYLTINKQKTLPVTITQDELRKISCGQETYEKIRVLILSKVTESIEAYIRDEIYCLINDPANYKKIEEIVYSCDDCSGQNFISALTEFAINLQINAKDYNIAGRNYDLPLKKKTWLLNSTKLASKLASRYAQGGTNASYIDISSKFAKTFDIPQLKMADGIIMDVNWLQVRKIFSELSWRYEPSPRAECGVYNFDMKIKPVNFFVAVPFKLIEISKEDAETAENLALKIEDLEKEFSVADETDAETQIKAEIDLLNTTEPKMTLEYAFSNFVAPDAKDGSIKLTVVIINKKGTKITTANNSFVLKKK